MYECVSLLDMGGTQEFITSALVTIVKVGKGFPCITPRFIRGPSKSVIVVD